MSKIMEKSMKSKGTFFLLCSFLMLLSGCSFFNKKPVDVSAKNEWVVLSNPLKAKDPNEFDAIIIGSGIGGLSCGAILAKNGYKVLVLEQHSQVGGYCSSYQRDGFTFNVGVEDISGLQKSGNISKLLHRLNLNQDDLFILNKRLLMLGDKKILITGTKDDFVKQLSKNFPQEKEAIEAFFNEAQMALEGNNLALRSWATTSYQQKLDEFFKNEALKTFLCTLIGYLGTKPEQTPAVSALYACLQYFIYGGYFPKGGAQHFANTLKDFIEAHSGTVHTNCKVEKILVENGQVAGVQTKARMYKSSLVVANVNAKTTFLDLLPKGTIDQNFIDAIGSLKMSTSLIVVHLGVDMDLSHLPSLINILDKGSKCHILIGSSADPSLAPKGKASVSILLGGNYHLTPNMETAEYAKFKEDMAQKAIVNAEKIIPNLSKHIMVKEVLTPRSFERFTSMPEGAIYAFDQSLGRKRPYFKTPLKGLYLASASSNGGGVELVANAGLKCADDILATQNNI